MNWFVLYVKSRTEKKVAARLKGQGFTVFCPTKIEERRWSDRIKKVEMPYFKSYVFIQIAEKQAPEVLKTPGVVCRLFWLRQPAVIYDKEMQKVIQFFSDNKNNTIEYEAFKAGDEVRIHQGKLQDHKGVVLRNDKTKVTLSLPALGCALKVTLPKYTIGRTG